METRVLDFMGADSPGDDAFEALALEVFAYQYESNALYRRFCDGRGADPDRVASAAAIPAAPADLFKHADDGAGKAANRIFQSSGTTLGPDRRSVHATASVATYERSAMSHFKKMVLADSPGPMRVVHLGPNEASHPNSSLACMYDWCATRFGDGNEARAFLDDGSFDMKLALEAIEAAAAGTAPTLVLAVSSSLTAVLDQLRDRGATFRLPADSRIVDTGGRKASAAGTRVMSANGILKAVWRTLHVPAYLCINEYGMTELFSQFYDDALLSRFDGSFTPRAKLGPHWTRTTVVDPATLQPVADGEPGILRHLDLANWETISAVQTLDVGRKHGRGFLIEGRAEGAETRGCSQLLEQIVG